MKKENIFNEKDACTGAAGLPGQRVGTGPARRPYESPLVTVVSFKMERGFQASLNLGIENRGSDGGFLSSIESRQYDEGFFGSGIEGRGSDGGGFGGGFESRGSY